MTGSDKRFARGDDQGQFTKYQVDVGRSISADRQQKAKSVAKPGQGDRGDEATKP